MSATISKLLSVGERFPDGCVKKSETGYLEYTVPVTVRHHFPSGDIVESASLSHSARGPMTGLLQDPNVRKTLERGEGLSVHLMEKHGASGIRDIFRYAIAHPLDGLMMALDVGCLGMIGGTGLTGWVLGGSGMIGSYEPFLIASLAGGAVAGIGTAIAWLLRSSHDSHVKGFIRRSHSGCSPTVEFVPAEDKGEYRKGEPVQLGPMPAKSFSEGCESGSHGGDSHLNIVELPQAVPQESLVTSG